MMCSLRVRGETLHLRRRGEPFGDRPAEPVSPLEAASVVECIPAGTAELRGDLLRALEHVQGHFVHSQLGVGELRSAVARALREGELVAFRPVLPGGIARVMESDPVPVKPTHVDDDTPPDVYVIAPEVRLIGAGVTPLIKHRVRVLDPDTDEVVVDWRMTDDKGVIRAEVPENKTYRIEIADLNLPWPHPPMLEEPPHALLRCHILDEDGAPVANENVVVVHPDGHEWEHATDEDGRLEMPVWLGHYTLKVRDQELAAHAVLQRDKDNDESVYRFVIPSANDSGPAADPLNRLERYETQPGPEDFVA